MFDVAILNDDEHPAVMGLLRNCEHSRGCGLSVDDYVGFMIDIHPSFETYYDEIDALGEEGREFIEATLRCGLGD